MAAEEEEEVEVFLTTKSLEVAEEVDGERREEEEEEEGEEGAEEADWVD